MEHDNQALHGNLGDFTATRRLVLIAALAIPIGSNTCSRPASATPKKKGAASAC